MCVCVCVCVCVREGGREGDRQTDFKSKAVSECSCIPASFSSSRDLFSFFLHIPLHISWTESSGCHIMKIRTDITAGRALTRHDHIYIVFHFVAALADLKRILSEPTRETLRSCDTVNVTGVQTQRGGSLSPLCFDKRGLMLMWLFSEKVWYNNVIKRQPFRQRAHVGPATMGLFYTHTHRVRTRTHARNLE